MALRPALRNLKYAEPDTSHGAVLKAVIDTASNRRRLRIFLSDPLRILKLPAL